MFDTLSVPPLFAVAMLFRNPSHTMPSAAAPSAAFEELALPLFPSLYNHAFWLTRNHAEAEDLVQETFSKALRAFDSFQPNTNFKAWIFRILRNTFLTTRTGIATSRTVFLEDHPEIRAHGHHLALGELVHPLAVDPHNAAVGAQQAGDDLEDRRLGSRTLSGRLRRQRPQLGERERFELDLDLCDPFVQPPVIDRFALEQLVQRFELLAAAGPEELFREAVATVKAECGLTESERKN